MKHFLLFLVGLIALTILLFNLGPLVILLVSVWLLYLIFKQFMKSESTLSKIGWVILGLIVLSIGISNSFALIGLVALAVLYYLYKKWRENKEDDVVFEQDSFINFEQQWNDLNK